MDMYMYMQSFRRVSEEASAFTLYRLIINLVLSIIISKRGCFLLHLFLFHFS